MTSMLDGSLAGVSWEQDIFSMTNVPKTSELESNLQKQRAIKDLISSICPNKEEFSSQKANFLDTIVWGTALSDSIIDAFNLHWLDLSATERKHLFSALLYGSSTWRIKYKLWADSILFFQCRENILQISQDDWNRVEIWWSLLPVVIRKILWKPWKESWNMDFEEQKKLFSTHIFWDCIDNNNIWTHDISEVTEKQTPKNLVAQLLVDINDTSLHRETYHRSIIQKIKEVWSIVSSQIREGVEVFEHLVGYEQISDAMEIVEDKITYANSVLGDLSQQRANFSSIPRMTLEIQTQISETKGMVRKLIDEIEWEAETILWNFEQLWNQWANIDEDCLNGQEFTWPHYLQGIEDIRERIKQIPSRYKMVNRSKIQALYEIWLERKRKHSRTVYRSHLQEAEQHILDTVILCETYLEINDTNIESTYKKLEWTLSRFAFVDMLEEAFQNAIAGKMQFGDFMPEIDLEKLYSLQKQATEKQLEIQSKMSELYNTISTSSSEQEKYDTIVMLLLYASIHPTYMKKILSGDTATIVAQVLTNADSKILQRIVHSMKTREQAAYLSENPWGLGKGMNLDYNFSWKEWWRMFVAEFIGLGKTQVWDQKRILCLPGIECHEAEFYINMGVPARLITWVERAKIWWKKDEEGELTFIDRSTALGINSYVWELKKYMKSPETSKQFDVVNLDMLGPLSEEIFFTIWWIDTPEQLDIIINVSMWREQNDIADEIEKLKRTFWRFSDIEAAKHARESYVLNRIRADLSIDRFSDQEVIGKKLWFLNHAPLIRVLESVRDEELEFDTFLDNRFSKWERHFRKFLLSQLEDIDIQEEGKDNFIHTCLSFYDHLIIPVWIWDFKTHVYTSSTQTKRYSYLLKAVRLWENNFEEYPCLLRFIYTLIEKYQSEFLGWSSSYEILLESSTWEQGNKAQLTVLESSRDGSTSIYREYMDSLYSEAASFSHHYSSAIVIDEAWNKV